MMFNTSTFYWLARYSWSRKDCYDIDWEGMEIRAFDARVLEKTCQEVTTSPTWILKND
jgi:hypothetical protein